MRRPLFRPPPLLLLLRIVRWVVAADPAGAPSCCHALIAERAFGALLALVVSTSTYGFVSILRKVTIMRADQRVRGALLLVAAQVSLVAACSMTIQDSGGGADTGPGTGASTSSGGPGGGEPAPSGGPGGGEPAPSGGPGGGEPAPSGGPGGGEPTSSGGPAGGAPAPETAVDLFACGFEPSCDQLRWYIDVEPIYAFECAARLVLSGGTGVITAVDGADGGIDETETLVVVLGDGTGLVQTRERRCKSDILECNDPPWEALSRHRLCDLEVPSPAKEACEQNLVNRCEWSPLDLKNCRDVEESTCEDVARRL